MTLEELHNYWCREFSDGDPVVQTHKDRRDLDPDEIVIKVFPFGSEEVISRREALLLTRELVRALGIE